MPSFKILTPSLSHLTHKDYSHIYEPAEDSFLLLDALEDDLQFILQRKPVFCVEVGSGSGIVSAAIAQSLGSSAFCMAIDLNPVACFATCRTAASNNVQVDVIRGDLVHPLLAAGSVDLLVFNPPYVPTPHCEMAASLDDPLVRSWAGGEHGREVMDRLFPLLPGLLAPQGLFYLVAIEDNDVQQIQELLSNLGFHSLEVKKRSVRGENLVILRIERKNLRTETHTT